MKLCMTHPMPCADLDDAKTHNACGLMPQPGVLAGALARLTAAASVTA